MERPRFAIPLTGARGQLQLTPVGHPRLDFPDCAVCRGDRDSKVVAVELERTAKGRARLRRILSGYVAARQIEGVSYYTTTQRVRELVGTEVATLRAQGLIEVRGRDSDGSADAQAA